MLGFGDVRTILGDIFTVAQAIYEHVNLVKANKAQCNQLALRIKIIESAVRGLEKLPNLNKNQYETGLRDLLTGLQECLKFIQQFVQSSKWYRWILKAGTYKEQFAELNGNLQKSMQQLNLGLAAQQIINHTEDKKAQDKDNKFIIDNQNTIIQLNQDAVAEIQKLKLQEQERQEILLQQLMSMKARITELNIHSAPKKPLIDPRYKVPFFDLAFDSKLAEGTFGKVYLGRWHEQEVAIKTFDGLITEQDTEQFVREVQIMTQLRSPYITQFYSVCHEENRACIVMEYMAKGSLQKVLSSTALSPEQQKQMALQVARGLHYLHKQNVLHRDLKSANVLVDSNWNAKLADFGLSKTKSISVKTIHTRSQALQWQAPECFQRAGTYSEKSDIYSYGVILWEIMTGKQPFDGVPDKAVIDAVLKGQRDIIPASVPAAYVKIIQQCWHADPAQRPALEQIIKEIENYSLAPAASCSTASYLASPDIDENYKQAVIHEKQKDYNAACVFYQKSVESEYEKAYANLGLFHLQGKGGLPVDKKQAYELFLKGAQKGHVRAMINLATMLEYGDGVSKNLTEALKWYKKAADVGDPKAREKYNKLQAVLSAQPTYSSYDASFG